VFSVESTDEPVDWLDNDHVICIFCDACPFRGYISKSDRIRSRQLRAVAAEAREQEANSSRSTEEYKKSVCEDLTCDLKTLWDKTPCNLVDRCKRFAVRTANIRAGSQERIQRIQTDSQEHIKIEITVF
jgi:hypothetical protein